MVTEQIRVTEASGILDYEDLLKDVTEQTTQDATVAPIHTAGTAKEYLTAEDDPVLAKLWDNDADAVFDTM